jgi:replicative DNA helicase
VEGQLFNIDAERATLGCILFDPKALPRVRDILQTDGFFVQAHQIIYQTAIALYDAGMGTDPITMQTKLSDLKQLEQIGGAQYLFELVNITVSATNVDRYAVMVMDKYVRRKLAEVSVVISNLASDTTIETQKVLDQAEQLILQVSQGKFVDTFRPLSDVVVEIFQKIEASEGQPVPVGIPTGLTELDLIITGLQKGQLISIGARPAMGKSALAVCMAENVARQGHGVGIFTLEMLNIDLGYRIVSSAADISTRRLKEANLTEMDVDRLILAIKDVSSLPIYLSDRSSLTLSDVRASVRQLKQKVPHLGLIIVDYLQLLDGIEATKWNTASNAIGKISNGLKKLAVELQIPIIILSQLSRGVEARQDKRPICSDLRESGNIEQDCDVVAMLYRDIVYNENTPDIDVAEIGIVKNRSGPNGVARVGFNPTRTKFYNLSPSTQEQPIYEEEF